MTTISRGSRLSVFFTKANSYNSKEQEICPYLELRCLTYIVKLQF